MKTDNKCITVYVPDSLENDNVGFLPGFIRKDGQDVKFYINDNKLRDDSTGCIGYCGLAQVKPLEKPPIYWIRVSFSDGQFQVSHILCDQIQEYKLLYVFYDFDAFKKSHLTFLSLKRDNEFYYLSKSLLNDRYLLKNSSYFDIFYRFLIFILISLRKVFQNLKHCIKPLSYSSTFQHLEGTLTQVHCIFDEIVRKRSLSIRARHVIVTRAVDIALGVLLLQYILSYQGISPIEYTETLIMKIGELLKFLMGSPVGLKLNAAFNKTLGSFFLYHITLWNTFLRTVANLISMGSFGGSLLTIICALGLTQQLAVASDILALATFHVHCIYVYAARLYGTQIYGLVALWRLFLGRKRNPLKERVDTYKYSSRQLFVGTLAFTILLFLLPTTALYYLVFVTFRLLLLMLSNILNLLRTAALRAPIYLTCLWLVNSPKIRSQVHITARPSSGALALDATLKAGSWRTCCLEPSFATLPSSVIPESARKLGLLTTIASGDLL